MALSTTQIEFLNRILPALSYKFTSYQNATPTIKSILLGDTISTLELSVAGLEGGTGILYGAAGAMAVAGVAAANDAGVVNTSARIDHVHIMPAASVVTALAATTTAVAFNTKKLSLVADGVAATDAATKGQMDLLAGTLGGFVKRTVTIDHADFVGLGAGDKAEVVNIGVVLPADARIVGLELDLTESFNGPALGSCTLSVGGSGPTSLVNAEGITAANSGNFPMGLFGLAAAAGPGRVTVPGNKAYPLARYSSQQLVATITSTVCDLKDLTAGTVTVNVFYIIIA